jgi:PilZ domain
MPKEVPLDSPIRNDRRAGNGVRVGDKRNAIRLDCDYKCLLKHDDIVYPCEIKNFSTSGALVDASFIVPVNIQLGDTCDLLFSTHLTMSPLDYKSKVTRYEDSRIALQFLDPAF